MGKGDLGCGYPAGGGWCPSSQAYSVPTLCPHTPSPHSVPMLHPQALSPHSISKVLVWKQEALAGTFSGDSGLAAGAQRRRPQSGKGPSKAPVRMDRNGQADRCRSTAPHQVSSCTSPVVAGGSGGGQGLSSCGQSCRRPTPTQKYPAVTMSSEAGRDPDVHNAASPFRPPPALNGHRQSSGCQAAPAHTVGHLWGLVSQGSGAHAQPWVGSARQDMPPRCQDGSTREQLTTVPQHRPALLTHPCSPSAGHTGPRLVMPTHACRSGTEGATYWAWHWLPAPHRGDQESRGHALLRLHCCHTRWAPRGPVGHST